MPDWRGGSLDFTLGTIAFFGSRNLIAAMLVRERTQAHGRCGCSRGSSRLAILSMLAFGRMRTFSAKLAGDSVAGDGTRRRNRDWTLVPCRSCALQWINIGPRPHAPSLIAALREP